MADPGMTSDRDAQKLFQQFIAQHDGPAYLRRARRLNDAIAALHERCRKQREEWLLMPRLHLGRLRALAGVWENLRPLVHDDAQLAQLERCHAELEPKLRLPLDPTTSARQLRQGLRAVLESNRRFNDRWRDYISRLDLTEVNALIDGYNRYYLVEKECVVSSPRIARMGFVPRQPIGPEELFAAWPLLPVWA